MKIFSRLKGNYGESWPPQSFISPPPHFEYWDLDFSKFEIDEPEYSSEMHYRENTRAVPRRFINPENGFNWGINAPEKQKKERRPDM